MSKSREMLKSAEKLSASAGTWADLSNALFDPNDGLIAKAFPTRESRQHSFNRTNTSKFAS